MKNTYLATVKADFKLTDAFKKKLNDQGIQILDYHKNLNILKLASEQDILSLRLKPITSIERDRGSVITKGQKQREYRLNKIRVPRT